MVSQHRATQRYRAITPDDEKQLVKHMLDFARKHPRYGYRRITALMRRAGWTVNKKRIQRLWREQGLKVPQKQHKKRRLGSSANGCTRRKSEHRNHVWTYDFVFDRTDDGRTLKFLTVIDEFTRECLALPVGRHFTSQDVIGVLAGIVAQRGAPAMIRSDNGPEFVAVAIRAWFARTGIATAYIEPGSPWENAYIETFNGKLRDELLQREIFMTVAEAKHLATGFRFEYNNNRPHSSLGYKTPREFAAGCAPFGSATLRLRAHTRTVSQPVSLS